MHMIYLIIYYSLTGSHKSLMRIKNQKARWGEKTWQRLLTSHPIWINVVHCDTANFQIISNWPRKKAAQYLQFFGDLNAAFEEKKTTIALSFSGSVWKTFWIGTINSTGSTSSIGMPLRQSFTLSMLPKKRAAQDIPGKQRGCSH